MAMKKWSEDENGVPAWYDDSKWGFDGNKLFRLNAGEELATLELKAKKERKEAIDAEKKLKSAKRKYKR